MVQLDTEVKHEAETLTDFSLFSSTLYSGVKSSWSVDKFTCMASVRVPDEDENDDTPTDTTRAPVLVVAVVDKSGSMSGPKMASLKTTLQFIIAELGKKDKLAIVEYDTNVTTSLPVTLMNEEGKQQAKRACDALHPGSATNLSGGLLAGLRLIPSDLGSDTVVSTLLLTDGLANHGIRSAKGIIAMVQKAQSEGIGRSTVNTFGFGSDHDATMLKEIAQACEGTYYFVENEDSIASSFADCIGGLLSVRAQGVELEIETSEGIVLGQVFTGKPVSVVAPGRVVRIAMGDLQSGEERDVPFEVQLPSTTSGDSQPIASVKLRFYDMIKNEMRELVTEVKIARPDELTEQHRLPNLMVDRNCNRIKGANAARDAIVFAEAKNFSEGRLLLERVIAEIQASPSASEEFCVTLIAELRDSLNSMRDQNEYRRVGQYKMNNFAHVMVHQRCANWSPSVEATPVSAPAAPPSFPGGAPCVSLPAPPPSAQGFAKKPMYSTNARCKMQSKWK